MSLDLDSLAAVYRAKTDEEPLVLASESSSLVEKARGVLADELRLRNLTIQPLAADTADVASDSTSSQTKFVASALMLGLIVVVATFLLKVFGLPFKVSLPGTIVAFLIRYYIISAKRHKNQR